MAECVSCGDEANAKSPREFCGKCDKEFEDGLKHAEAVVARAEKLDKAKAQGDKATVSQIMAEIFAESVVDGPPATVSPVSSATARKADK